MSHHLVIRRWRLLPLLLRRLLLLLLLLLRLLGLLMLLNLCGHPFQSRPQVLFWLPLLAGVLLQINLDALGAGEGGHSIAIKPSMTYA
jgi:hypothetical protein